LCSRHHWYHPITLGSLWRSLANSPMNPNLFLHLSAHSYSGYWSVLGLYKRQVRVGKKQCLKKDPHPMRGGSLWISAPVSSPWPLVG
jgi:hypothetical protein